MNAPRNASGRLGTDRTTVALLVALVLIGVFVAWQLTRIDAGGAQADAAPAGVAGGTGGSVEDTLRAVEKLPVSRPQLAVAHWITANGARVSFVPAPELPMVDVRVVFDGGGARDRGHAGRSRQAVLTSGTRHLRIHSRNRP